MSTAISLNTTRRGPGSTDEGTLGTVRGSDEWCWKRTSYVIRGLPLIQRMVVKEGLQSAVAVAVDRKVIEAVEPTLRSFKPKPVRTPAHLLAQKSDCTTNVTE